MTTMIVTVQRRDREDREIVCRVTDAHVDAYLAEQGIVAASESLRDATRARIARDRAAKRLYGRGVSWQSGGVVPHRGQIWTPAKGGGSSAVTSEITMRVESR